MFITVIMMITYETRLSCDKNIKEVNSILSCVQFNFGRTSRNQCHCGFEGKLHIAEGIRCL